MTYEPERHHRRSIRLQGYDYSQEGAYYVTIVCRDRTPMLEDPALRAIVEDGWLWLASQYAYVHLDEYIIMPNHLHGIVVISDVVQGGSRAAPTASVPKRKALGSIIGAFKTVSAKRINELLDTHGSPVWQRDYWERIIRDQAEMNRIRQYIRENPAHWASDPENPSIAPGVAAARSGPDAAM